MKNVKKLSEQELSFGMKTSWHDQYKQSAWIFVGGLPFDLTEGDIICVFSQYGEVVNINLVRSKDTGKSKGFCFICYEDQRSTNLAVDNLNGIKLLNRTIRVDHCEGYKAPKDDKMDEDTRALHAEGCAPGSKFGNLPKLPSSTDSNGGLDKGFNLPPLESLLKLKTEKEDVPKKLKDKKGKKDKKNKKTKEKIKKLFRKKKKEDSSSSNSSSESSSESDDEKSRKKKSKKEKLKRRKDEVSSSSSDDSDSDESRSKMKKKQKKESSSDSSSDEEPQKRTEMYRKEHSKNKRLESKELEGRNKGNKLDRSQMSEFSERSSDRGRKLTGENNRENSMHHGSKGKSKDDERYDRDRRDDRDRFDRGNDRDRRDQRDIKHTGDKHYEDSRRYHHERKERDRR